MQLIAIDMLTKTALPDSVINKFVPVYGTSFAVVQTAAPAQLQSPEVNHLLISLTDEKAISEFKNLMHRAINTWPDAPAWAIQLSDHLKNMPNA